MISRFLFILAVALALALPPVSVTAACANLPVASECHGCCADPLHPCCAVAPGSTSPQPAPQTAPGVEKQLLSPAFIFLCLSPLPAAEPPAVQRQQAARRPALPLLALHCIRLI